MRHDRLMLAQRLQPFNRETKLGTLLPFVHGRSVGGKLPLPRLQLRPKLPLFIFLDQREPQGRPIS